MEEQWRGQGLNAQEIETIVRLTNALLPFTIPMQNATKKPGYGLPLVVLSNCLLQIAGYGDFTSEISPMPSAAAVYPLRLNATGVYEVFLSGTISKFLQAMADVLPVKKLPTGTRR